MKDTLEERTFIDEEGNILNQRGKVLNPPIRQLYELKPTDFIPILGYRNFRKRINEFNSEFNYKKCRENFLKMSAYHVAVVGVGVIGAIETLVYSLFCK